MAGPSKQGTPLEWKIVGCLLIGAPVMLGSLMLLLALSGKVSDKSHLEFLWHVGSTAFIVPIVIVAIIQVIRKSMG